MKINFWRYWKYAIVLQKYRICSLRKQKMIDDLLNIEIIVETKKERRFVKRLNTILKNSRTKKMNSILSIDWMFWFVNCDSKCYWNNHRNKKQLLICKINKYDFEKFSKSINDSNVDVDWLNIEISKKNLKFEFDVSKSIFWTRKKKCECLFNFAYHKRTINKCIKSKINNEMSENSLIWWFKI